MKIVCAYDYLFYRVYAFHRANCSTSDREALFTASLSLVAAFSFNFLFIWELMDILLRGGKTSLPNGVSYLEITAVATIIGFLQYRFWVRDARYEAVAKRFEAEPAHRQYAAKVMATTYIVASFVSVFAGAIVGGWISGTL